MLVPLYILLGFIFNIFGKFAHSEVAFFGRQPTAINPTLYDPKVDLIIQLDDMTFDDTVFCKQQFLPSSITSKDKDCPAYVIEFYFDWCGHCRSYAGTYKSLARDIHGWNKVVRLAAVNCADPLNEITCQINNVLFAPLIKYFARNITDAKYGLPLKTLNSVNEMRDLITQVILLDYNANPSPNWPNFDFLPHIENYGELWENVEKSIPFLVIIFEDGINSLIGAQLLLDMMKYGDRLMARRCLKNHTLTDALHIKNFPSMAIFKREQTEPLLIADLRQLLFNELEKFLGIDDNKNETGGKNVVKNQTLCDRDIVLCRQRFYASETDMLKAVRNALFDEVVRTGKQLTGNNLTAIRDFLDILAKNFPTKTIYFNISDDNEELRNSKRAVNLFKQMRNFMDENESKGVVPMKEYREKFLTLEEENNYPFPVNANWEHCAGSSPNFRGYSCGLWTLFHVLTVQAYKNGLNDSKFVPLTPLVAIRNWIHRFFGCQHCREHFLRMANRTFRMESQVNRPEDSFMYLWQAHNMVNARLRGQPETEDPEFPKRQFPPDFLCSTCRHGGYFDNEKVKDFLLIYYRAIRPISKQKQLIPHANVITINFPST